MSNETNRLLETMQQSAQNLLRRIEDVRSASDEFLQRGAELELREDAARLRQQSSQLERALNEDQPVYLGG